jgi:hypothetical protein
LISPKDTLEGSGYHGKITQHYEALSRQSQGEKQAFSDFGAWLAEWSADPEYDIVGVPEERSLTVHLVG